ncbi:MULTISPECIES: helix-turn-helix domain-containing protein [unclassified Brevundimonas]|uniref:helix-turn-helix domain-containing protein n=1 Tax=unclassified Brevundimonas TaxID=2622653 RepID=UPI0005F78E56|nr:helix-turn-helix domain-containing protein [Brevundimonas sp. KM4]KJV43364.1 hypothetical protein VH88_01340 [Brevundimonas sp. KM4]
MAHIASEIDVRIGGEVRARRDKLKVTQAQLASAIGVTFQPVQKYERGVNRISAATLLAIAEALNCHVADLYGDPDPQAISHSERAILKLWQDLREPERDAVIAMIRAFQKD